MRSYAGYNNVGLDEDMCVCVLPNKDQTSVQAAPTNPAKSDGKKGNICPSPASDINSTDDDPDMRCKLLLYNSIKQVLGGQLAQLATVGSLLPPDTSRFRLGYRIREWTRPNLQAAAFVLWSDCM